MSKSKPSLSANELAQRWHIPIATLRQWRWLKKGPCSHKIEGITRYYLEDIEAFEEACLRHHTTMTSNPTDKSS